MNAPLRLERRDGIAAITLMRPDCRNALSRQLLIELSETLKQALSLGASAITLSGEGGFFSAGADLREMQGTLEDASFDDQIAATIQVIRTAPIPVVAAIEGGCIGAGLDLALACDLRVVAQSAFLELPAIRMGLLYSPAALARIARQVPSATLARLLLAGERIRGADTLAAGLATHITADGGAVPLAHEVAGRFQNLSKEAVAATKSFLCASSASDMDLEIWQQQRMALLASRERKIAVERSRKPSNQ